MTAEGTKGTDLTPQQRNRLLDAAYVAVRSGLDGGPIAIPDVESENAALAEPAASFVTLRRGPALLGCVGTMEPHRPLLVDVAANAAAAAFRDPRLPAVTRADYTEMSVKVSVLTPLEPLTATDDASLLARIRPGTDGLLLVAGPRRATLLPAVWEQLPDPADFLTALWQKAGLRPGTWRPDTRLDRYETVEFGAEGPRTPAR